MLLSVTGICLLEGMRKGQGGHSQRSGPSFQFYWEFPESHPRSLSDFWLTAQELCGTPPREDGVVAHIIAAFKKIESLCFCLNFLPS